MTINMRILVRYQLVVQTGLHIGGNKDVYGIGGVDSPVIKNPLTNEPIIPGSSIKGKVRSLLEMTSDNNDLIKKVFGDASEKSMTRIVFRDLFITKESSEKLQHVLGKGFFTEIKAENSIDKTLGTANSPRFIERVPAGTVFEGEYIINSLQNDNTDDICALINRGFMLLNNNYLGGNGSRGYGKVEFIQLDKKVL